MISIMEYVIDQKVNVRKVINMDNREFIEVYHGYYIYQYENPHEFFAANACDVFRAETIEELKEKINYKYGW